MIDGTPKAPKTLIEGSAASPLRGLSPQESERRVAAVLASVAWDGLPPDPNALSARDFLALL